MRVGGNFGSFLMKMARCMLSMSLSKIKKVNIKEIGKNNYTKHFLTKRSLRKLRKKEIKASK